MSARDDVGIIREAFARWNKCDIDYWIDHSHPDVEIWSKYAALDEGGGPYRGRAGMREWRAEIDRKYVKGPTTYSWKWDRYDVSIAGPIAWILAEGIETEQSGDRRERHPYRMTMVLERRQDASPRQDRLDA